MKICENFYTLQGEGKYLGVPSYFIRTVGCNLRCAWKNNDKSITLCDTPYTSWNIETGQQLNFLNIIDDIKKYNVNHIVITGGEPFLQKDISDVVTQLQEYEKQITIETNGTIFNRNIQNCFLSFSPKLNSSYSQLKNSLEQKIHKQNNYFLSTINDWLSTKNDYQIKFVYNTEQDLNEILTIQKELNIPANKIYLMPQGITQDQLKEKQQKIFNICLNHGFNYSPRMHIDIFGNKRGI